MALVLSRRVGPSTAQPLEESLPTTLAISQPFCE